MKKTHTYQWFFITPSQTTLLTDTFETTNKSKARDIAKGFCMDALLRLACEGKFTFSRGWYWTNCWRKDKLTGNLYMKLQALKANTYRLVLKIISST